MKTPKFPVALKDKERENLEKITRQQTVKSSIVLRAKILLLANSGMKYQDIAQKLDVKNTSLRTGLPVGMHSNLVLLILNVYVTDSK